MRRKRATNNRSKGNAGGGDNDDDDNNSNNNNSHDLEDANGADDSYSSFHESSEGGSQKNNGNGGGGGGGGGTSVDNDKEKKQKFAAEVRQVQKIASREQNCMQIFKCMGLFISIAAAILVSTGTYIVLTNEESVDYVENFHLFCNTIQDVAQFHAKNMFLAMDMCGQAITSAAIATNATFPFVTVPNFEVLGAATRAQSGIEMLFWQPILVNDKKKQKWIEYSLQNQGWINESRALAMKHAQQQQEQDGNTTTYSSANYIFNSIPDFIWDRDENLVVRPTVAPPSYIPVWQVSPPPFHPGFVNFNLPTFPGNKDQLEATYINRAPLIAKAIDLSRLGLVAQNPADHDAYHSLFVDWNKQQQQLSDNKNSPSSISSAFDTPHSLFTQPIFEELYNASSEIVGFVMGVVPWDMYMTNLLPSGIDGITCVLENSCGQAFTYQLHGNRAVYVGEGDLHDTRYSDMRVVVPFEEPKGFSHSSGSSSSNSNSNSNSAMSNQQPVMDDSNNKTDDEDTNGQVGSCHYQFALYPTQEFEDSYHTNIPQVMTITVACIFSAMAVTFILYDFMVYRRNSKIIKIAARSGAIVSSLFPSTVRDRLFAAKAEEKNIKVGNSDHDKAALHGDKPTSLKAFMSEDGAAGRRDSLSMDEVFKQGGHAPSVGGGGGRNARSGNDSGGGYSSGEDDGDDYILKTKPIADLFPATTIMFADISGFTSWSASRDPEAVFTLLETLYRAFDAIAKKRRVYKVETIGDCYVAVVGLPEPRDNHALVMAQFASEIRKRFNFLIHKKLVPVLGADTGRLCLRAGLHSGPVTAGVLRGENARFQLFGDTMNTASRMESNGKPDLIQVSQETADLIVCGGKPHWVTPREDKIQAKGKGELQTYWLDLQRKNKNTTYAESNFSSFDASSMDGDSTLPKRSTGTATSGEDNGGHVTLSASSFHDDSTTVNDDSPQEDQAVTLSSLLQPHESSDHDDEFDLSRSLSQPWRPPTEKQQEQKREQEQKQEQEQHQQQQQQQQQQQHLHDSNNIEYYGYEDHNDDSNNTQDTEKLIVCEARKLSLKEGGSGSERQIMMRKNSLLAC